MNGKLARDRESGPIAIDSDPRKLPEKAKKQTEPMNVMIKQID